MSKVGAVLAVSLALAGTAHAQRRLQVDDTVTSVVFDAGTRTRAIAGDDNGAYILIERLPARGGASDQVWIDFLPLGRSKIPLTEFKSVVLLSLQNNTLTFEAAPRVKGGQRSVVACRATLEIGRGRVEVKRADCTAGGQPYTPPGDPNTPPAPVTLTTSDLDAIAKDCATSFSYSSDKEKCMDTVVAAHKTTRFPASLRGVIAACRNAFSFTSDRNTCMSTSYAAAREPVELVQFCTKQHSYTSDRHKCIVKFGAMP